MQSYRKEMPKFRVKDEVEPRTSAECRWILAEKKRNVQRLMAIQKGEV